MDHQKEKGTIVIDKEYYYKTYMEQRQKLHVNLVQQLHLRAEAKKMHILNKSNEIIEKFVQYRDEFLQNMPSELKTLKVQDYINQSDGTLQVFLKQSGNEGGLSGLYKLFQNEFERINSQAHKPIENLLNNNNQTSNFGNDKNKFKAFETSGHDDTVLEFIDSIKEKENDLPKPKFDVKSNKQSAMKSKVRPVATPLKSTKKRKWDQITSAGKENNNLGVLGKNKNMNGTTTTTTTGAPKPGTAKKVLLEKTNTMHQIPNNDNQLISPNKRPWMP